MDTLAKKLTHGLRQGERARPVPLKIPPATPGNSPECRRMVGVNVVAALAPTTSHSKWSLVSQEREHTLRDLVRLREHGHTRLLQDLQTRERGGFGGEVSILDA